MEKIFVDTFCWVALTNPQNTWSQLEITEILTHDHHFTQEGFVILLP